MPERIGQFKCMDHIGKGSFAEVYRGIHIEKRQAVAIKSVNMTKLNKKLKENLISEISILRSLHHPHIVSLIDCHESTSTARMHIIMEFCELGDLSAFIKKRDQLGNHPSTQRMMEKYPNPPVGGLNEVVVRHFAKQIASALEFLRSKNYIHRDLKPQNLLLNPSSMFYSQSGTLERMPLGADANSLIPATGIESLPMLKIADFGFARILPTTSLAETLCGSPLYMAPEILRYEKYDPKADLWSVGTVLYEMVCARPPFRANNHVELLRRIEELKDQVKFKPDGIVVSRAMKNLIRGLLKRMPVERMNFDHFFNDPVIRDEIPGLVDEDVPHASQIEPAMHPVKAPITVPEQTRTSEALYSQSPKERNPYSATPPSRPASTVTTAPAYGSAPTRTSSTRKTSNTAITTLQQRVPSTEHRPPLASANTAPTRPTSSRDQTATPSSRPRSSREDTSTGKVASRERASQGTFREAAERAAQDAADDEFVFVEKRRVEIDALADEIAASPQVARDRISGRETMKRRATTQATQTIGTGAGLSKAIQIQQKPGVTHHRTGSYERRYRPSFESATSAITKAMNMVTIRGLGLSPPVGRGISPPRGYAAFPVYPAPPSSLLLVGDSGRTLSRDEDSATVKKIEELAQLSHVVFGFAEVKYKQLVPIAPSDESLQAGPSGIARKPSHNDEEDDDEDELTYDAIVTLSEEALVLFVKALALLNKAMDIAGTWYNRHHRRSPPPEVNSRVMAHTERLSQVVSWVRDRFNEGCVKSEIVARKLKQAQQQLPKDHPSHPANQSAESGSITTAVGSAENIILTTGVTAEKLMYDRAIEMSKSAAVNELVGTDLPGCEMNYWTAILMLGAILEDEEEPSKHEKNPNEEINGLESDDRETVQKLLESMKSRHRAMKKKIDAAKSSRRQIANTPTPQPASRGSPAS
ncbi:Serine/threonine-protein kinase atg1 [Sporormia fimetaria CBS 119925]|uniref:non-specific serine/threonine protein kinase n=1 Tax=Sporormia fimetaria CBS 119925 TaxID=1340428 RepID=A0A6A6VGK7_9PLEO|nr:Serine/threonine-protein kinase atg1 [Sporormia fimetaria CBS 119925]